MSDEHDTTAGDRAAAREPDVRADPRTRPPDPAGTRPMHDPDSLLPPARAPRPAPGAPLWDPSAVAPHDPDADAAADVADEDEAPERDDARVAAAPSLSEPAVSRYSPRFQFALGALLAIGAAAIVLLVAVIVGGGRTSGSSRLATGPAWSAWHPTASGGDGPTQIADHVGREYRLPDGRQLVAVTGGPLEIAGLPVTIALRETPAQGGDIKLIDGNGVLFRMCGLGDKCAISSGRASTQRHLLLRREALELALYSFRYLAVDEAVVFLPPKKGEDPTQAVFFRRADTDLRNAVAKPLDATLVGRTPSVSSVTRSPDAQLVQTITTSKLFSFSFTQANQDARAFLVLDPLPGN
ncbi:hypothetical protein [Baekduia soli]|uniref:hypothetical protein n=1 Tax=Baekduia soli TaxID=496014 RepID=UPI0016527CE5|nr:hypothetical protein [Baekduia soli]